MATQSRREKDKTKRRKFNAAAAAGKLGSQGGGLNSIKLPSGCDFYKLEAGTHDVDVLPFVAGENNPDADEGMETYYRRYDTHKIPTPANQFGESHCCLFGNWKEDCPVCTQAGRETGDMAKQLRAKSRILLLVNDRPGNPKNKVKVLETFQFNQQRGFAELLSDAINANPEKYQQWADLEEGFTLRLTIKDAGQFGNAISRIDFVERKTQYDADLIERMPCLDACLVKDEPEELEKLIGLASKSASKKRDPERKADDDDDSSPLEEPAAKKRKAPKDEDDSEIEETSDIETDDDEDSKVEKPAKKGKVTTAKQFGLKIGDWVKYQGDRCEIVKVSGDGTSLTLEDDDEETHRGVDPADVKKIKTAGDDDGSDVADEDGSEVEAPKKSGGKKKPAARDDDSDMEPDDEDASPVEDDDEDASPLEEPSDTEDDDEPADEDDSEVEKPRKKPAAKAPAKKTKR